MGKAKTKSYREQWIERMRAAGRLCTGTRLDGNPCNMPAVVGSAFCLWHDESPAGKTRRQAHIKKLAATRRQRETKQEQRRQERRGDDNG